MVMPTHSRMTRGFTLIEVLIASALGATLLGLLTMAFIGSRRAAERTEATATLHLDAAAIDRMFQEDLESINPGTKMELLVNRPDSVTAVTAKGSMRLDCMTTLERSDTTMGLGQDHPHDTMWTRWQWIASGVNSRPTLFRALSSPYFRGRFVDDGGTVRNMLEFPTPRRDRRGLLDANDGRTWNGFQLLDRATGGFDGWNGSRATFGFPSDTNDLNRRLVPIHANIEDLRLEWIDQGGHTVTGTSAGIVVRNETGSVVSPDSTSILPTGEGNWPLRAWWIEDQASRPDLMKVDGLWSDARPWTLGVTAALPAPTSPYKNAYPTTDSRTATERRPALIRISFTLTNDPLAYDDPQRGLNPRWVRQRFSFSHPVASTLPRPLP